MAGDVVGGMGESEEESLGILMVAGALAGLGGCM